MFMKRPKSKITGRKFLVHKIWPRSGGAFLLFILLYLGCGSTPSGLSGQEKEAFINTYVDLTIARARYGVRPREYDVAVKNIYAQYNTNPEIMKEYLQKMANNPQEQHEIYNAIADKLKRMEDIPADSLQKILKPLQAKP